MGFLKKPKFLDSLTKLDPVMKAIRGHGSAGRLIDRSMDTGEEAGGLVIAAGASYLTGSTAPLQLYAAGQQYVAQKEQAKQLADSLKAPGAPTIDEAAKDQQALDRIRRRRGVLANIYAGNTSSTPQVGNTTLGG